MVHANCQALAQQEENPNAGISQKRTSPHRAASSRAMFSNACRDRDRNQRSLKVETINCLAPGQRRGNQRHRVRDRTRYHDNGGRKLRNGSTRTTGQQVIDALEVWKNHRARNKRSLVPSWIESTMRCRRARRNTARSPVAGPQPLRSPDNRGASGPAESRIRGLRRSDIKRDIHQPLFPVDSCSDRPRAVMMLARGHRMNRSCD